MNAKLLGCIGWILMIISCHQGILEQNITTFNGVEQREDEDSSKDSIPIDTFVVIVPSDTSVIQDSISGAIAYEETFAPNTRFETKITVYKVNLDSVEITLLNGKFRSLAQLSKKEDKKYWMLTNGGMFDPKGLPVGLFQDDTSQVKTINQEQGYGNFFLHPNGVFYVTKDKQAGVLETQQFIDSVYNKETPLELATQSGPMLIINGAYHPKFNKKSSNKHIRSGVGVTEQQELIFILSEELVNFHTFARIFLAKGCKNALYLDGAISSMYIKNRGDNIKQFNTQYGPVIGIYPIKYSSIVIDSLSEIVTVPPNQDSTASSHPIQEKNE